MGTSWFIPLIVAAMTAASAFRPEAPSPFPTISAGGTGFSMKSSDGAFLLKIRGYVQSDGRFAAPATIPSADTFVLRRVRPTFEATMFARYSVKLMPDFGEGKTVLQDAFVDVAVNKSLKLRTGKFKSPFGLERLESATELLFTERAMPTQLAPNRDIGLMLYGDAWRDLISYQVAVVNGVADGSSADVEEHHGKDLVARILARPLATRRESRVVAGVAAAISAGQDRGSRALPALPLFRTASMQPFFRYRNDGTAYGTAVAYGDRVRGSLQGYWYQGPTAFAAEFTRTHQQVGIGGIVSSLDNTAWAVDASCFLWGKRSARQGGASPLRADARGNTAGALELAVRVTRLNVDHGAFPVFADPAVAASSASEWAIGGNWYANTSVKISSSLHRTGFGSRDPAGVRRSTEHALLTRLQFSF